MKFKTIAIELLILLVLFILAWAIVRLEIPHKNAFFPSLEIELHDNFFVMPWAEVVLQPFLLLAVVVYLAKEALFRYKSRFQNLILVLSNFILVTQLVRLFEFRMIFTLVSFFSHVKPATIYPPLFGLGDAQKSEELMRLVGQWNIMIWIVFLFFLLILVISALLTGINWNSPTDEIQK